MRFPLASTAGMVPEELYRSTARPACAGAHPHLFRQIPFRPVDGVGRAPTSSWGAALTSWTPERLPRRLARPELDNAVFASVLQPLANSCLAKAAATRSLVVVCY